MGYRCLVVIAGRTGDFEGYQPGDAARIVEELGTNMIDYSGPNEPWLNNGTTQSIIDRGIQVYNDIQTVAPGTKIWGPVHHAYIRDDLVAYMNGLTATRMAGVDYHNYAMGSTSISTVDAFDQTRVYASEVTTLRADAAARGIAPQVNVDELNFSWRSNDETPLEYGGFISPKSGQLVNGRFFTAINTVWMASAVGHILVNGGRAMPYATQNQALGIMVQNEYVGDTADAPDAGGVRRPDSSPMPGYWGIAMWTGGGMPNLAAAPSAQGRNFAHFKDTFYQVTQGAGDQLTEVFAVNNEAGGYNLVIINKREHAATSLSIALAGISGRTHDIWQTRKGPYPAQYESPVRTTTGQPLGANLRLDLPACTVTTVVIL